MLENGIVRLSGSGREVLEHPEIGALYLGGAVDDAGMRAGKRAAIMARVRTIGDDPRCRPGRGGSSRERSRARSIEQTRGLVNRETAERVLRVAEELGYRPTRSRAG